jgi:hypothetical protein
MSAELGHSPKSLFSSSIADGSAKPANPSRGGPAFETPAAAAVKLGVAPQALRARCRRAARRSGGAAVAPLGGGIVAFKFGRSWRIRMPSHD